MKEGQVTTADELLNKALRYKGYWGNKGGITVSGGEPLLQMDFLTELFRKAKAGRNPYNSGYQRQSLHRKEALAYQMAGADEVYRSGASGYQAD